MFFFIRNLIDKEDFEQISAMIDVFEGIIPTLDPLKKYIKVKKIIDDYSEIKDKLKSLLSSKIDIIIEKCLVKIFFTYSKNFRMLILFSLALFYYVLI